MLVRRIRHEDPDMGLGLEVRPVVAGRGITSEAEGLASRMGVGVVIDGKVRFRPGTSSS